LIDLEKNVEQTQKLRFENQGTEDIYINWQSPQAIWPQTLKIAAGTGAEYTIPSGSLPATRFWPKWGCDSTGQNCIMGESGGPNLPCPPSGCSPPIDSKFEATFGASDGNDWYDASQVDGWTLPYRMTFKCGATGVDTNLECTGLKASICPTQDIDGAGYVSLIASNVDRGDAYAGCYSPCGILTYSNWSNPYGKYLPTASPADKYCCAGAYQMPDQCKTGPDAAMEYTQIVHENCNAYAWAYDDDVGLQACDTNTTQFTVQFFDP